MLSKPFSIYYSGYISAAARREAVSVTLDSLENLHRSLASCPGESEKEQTPSCLAVPLMPHQERALKWLLWRETQVPAGIVNFIIYQVCWFATNITDIYQVEFLLTTWDWERP